MIVAECCGNWHDLKEAKAMIPIAKANGAGLVKFQLYDAEDDRGKPIYDFSKAHELTFEQAKELFMYGEQVGIEVFFSVFGVKYVEWCERIGVKRYKLAKGEYRLSILEAIAGTKKPAIISTDGRSFPDCVLTASTWSGGDIPERYNMGCFRTTWLYCPDGYPPKKLNLKKVNILNYGFSDHTIGLDAAKIALARGAQIIEKHFILEHNPAFPDDAWSMTPSDLKELARWEKVCKEVL